MMYYPLIVNPEAEIDLAEANRYYERQRTGLGREFLSCVDEAFAKLQCDPWLFAESYKAVRQTLVRRFPFVVCYTVENDRVYVIAVFHGRRNPNSWKSRITEPS